MTTKKLRLVEVEWEDTCSWHQWQPQDNARNIHDVSHCRSVGYLMVKDDKKVVIVQSLDDDGTQSSETLAIPRSTVKRMRYLK